MDRLGREPFGGCNQMLLTSQNSGPLAIWVIEDVIGSERGTRSLCQKLGRGCASWPRGGGLAHVKTLRPGATSRWEGVTLGQRVPHAAGVGKVRNGKQGWMWGSCYDDEAMAKGFRVSL